MYDFGRDSTVKALGKTWRIAKFQVAFWEELRDWIADQINLPARFARAKEFAPLLPAAAAKEYEEALASEHDLQNFSPACPLAAQFLGRTDEQGKVQGGNLMAWIVLYRAFLRPHHPDITDDEVFAIMQEKGKELAAAVKKAEGQMHQPKALRERMHAQLSSRLFANLVRARRRLSGDKASRPRSIKR